MHTHENIPIHMHVSPPCTGGSCPQFLQHLHRHNNIKEVRKGEFSMTNLVDMGLLAVLHQWTMQQINQPAIAF